jgi:uncharacterized protein (TIGR03032 family)
MEPAGLHDACFLPRASHCTGEVLIHEMAWTSRGLDERELWFVNTRFSCLCTLARSFSFVPRWRPPFITAQAPEDRCHLNGLGLADGQARTPSPCRRYFPDDARLASCSLDWFSTSVAR